MIPFKHLAQIAFHFTTPNKINKKEFWLSFIYPALIGLALSVFPILVWESIYLLVVMNILPEKLMIIINFMAKFIIFFLFTVPFLYTYMIVSIKRLHDIGRSGFWWLLNLIPVFISFVMTYLDKDALWLVTQIFPIVILFFILYISFSKPKTGIGEII